MSCKFGHQWECYVGFGGERHWKCARCRYIDFQHTPNPRFRKLGFWMALVALVLSIFNVARGGDQFRYDVDRNGVVDDWDKALYMLDMDGDQDIDLYDWATWEASFKEPFATVTVPLEHCPLMDSGIIRVYRMLSFCMAPIYPGDQLWFVAWPWPLQLNRWAQFNTGPK